MRAALFHRTTEIGPISRPGHVVVVEQAPPDILDWLQGDMDGVTLDFLDRFGMKRKGSNPDEEWGAEWLERATPGEIFPYPAAFPYCRRDVFIIGSRRFLATEHYDIEEPAEGPVVRLGISELSDSRSLEFLGLVAVHGIDASDLSSR